jgi:(p)ppGpp synthase/HD superfamily hydrolase
MLNFNEWLDMQENKHLKTRLGKKTVNTFKAALSFMPPKKVDHSLRVGRTVSKAGLDDDAVHAAILHDYIERGGDLNQLQNLGISNKTMRIIQMLSVDEKTPGLDDNEVVYQHMLHALDDLDTDLESKNIAIVVKASDRLDNLGKRVLANKLTPAYYMASRRLFDLLFSRYTGNRDVLAHIKKKLSKLERQVQIQVPQTGSLRATG